MKQSVDEVSQKTNSSVTKIKWRQHEIILVTANAVIILAGYLWQVYHTTASQYASPFTNNHVPFSLFKNVLLPDISIGLVIYLCYLWISHYTIPRFLSPKKFQAGTLKIETSFSKIKLQGLAKKIIKEYAWLFIQLILIVFMLGSVFDAATYLKHQWQFNYAGFSIFFNPDNPRSQLSLSAGFFAAASILVIYGLYVFIREVSIHSIERSKQREYNISICNKVTSFLLQFITVAVFLRMFNITHEPQFFVAYFLTIPALFAMFISNVYWLFPMKGDKPFFRKEIIIRLLSTSFVYAIPLVIFVHEGIPIAFLSGWALQLFIVTPITWWYYKTNEDKILQLRVVEKQLVKSKADLQFLRSQINPHFLFNVLNTLYGTALQENAALTAESIQKLGEMMRFMLHENNLDLIQMNKETEYLKNYIALQKLRIQSSPDIIIEDNISERNCNHKIAPMLLIPLVENAFKHGISLKEKSWIKIHLVCTEKDILFEVYNSVHAKTENDTERERSGIGLNNVLERLKLIYGGRFQASVNKDDKEFFVKLVIQP
jgi:two-component system, LytTR family, sensor kinase